MFFKSIRFKVLLGYMALLAITLLLFSGALYGSFDKILLDNLEDLLSSRAEGVADAVYTYLYTKEPNSNSNSFTDISKEWVEEKRKDPELMKVFVQILDTKGERLASPKSIPFLAPLKKADFEDILRGEDGFDTVKGVSSSGEKISFKVYSKPVIVGGKVMYIVQAVAPSYLLSFALKNLIIILFILIPITILLAGIPGVLLAGLTLRPVDTMINTLKQITAENLKLKIHLPDTKDEIKRLADTFNDMIERLDRSFSSQQSFIQDMSYELKAPLIMLKGEFMEAMKAPHSQETHKAILNKGLKELNDFLVIIEDLLVLAKFDNSQMPLQIKKVNLTRLLAGVTKNAKVSAGEKDIDVSSFLQDTITLDGDEAQLKRLFTNLLDNAIRYTYRKGTITVAAHRDGKFAKVTVSDTGIGMPEDELLYIFDRFYQINKSRVNKQSFGLGLSIAKSIAESHKGKIEVESQMGKGSIFTVYLPISYPA